MTEQTFTRLSADRYGDEHTTRSPTTDDRWDRGDTRTAWSIHGVYLDERGDIFADFAISEGDTVHIVYAIYSTGDSFGRNESGCLEFFTVHRDLARAEANADILRAQSSDRTNFGGSYNTGAALMTDNGLRLVTHVPWLGYFESLDEVCVETYVVGPDRETPEEKSSRREFEAEMERKRLERAEKAKKKAKMR